MLKPLSTARAALVCLAFLLPASPQSAGFPKPLGWVSDYAGVLDAGTRMQLSSLLGRLTEKTEAEIAVVVVRSLEGADVTSYANELFTAWKIGKKGKDNGVLLLVSIEEKALWIEVGYGLEGILPDGKCGEIREMMKPYMSGNPGRGIVVGGVALARVVAEDAGVSLEELAKQPIRRGFSRGRRSPLSMLFPIILMIVAWPLMRRNPFLFFLLMSGMMGGRGGGFGGGGFGGGFGGFGGGLSGGGGAGGRW